MTKVLVTASFGHIGQTIIPLLAADGVEVRAVDPDPANESALKKLGAKEVIVGDIRGMRLLIRQLKASIKFS
ncbi:hypothetical protein [Secundilactobacillus similis]|uniref:hypothetical protein n=1 Tax=Secundilactobacillus similis TaxID=414682 RepID=UPI0006D00956|nr:hypothetical protein [Secundilactobacillus similis]